MEVQYPDINKDTLEKASKKAIILASLNAMVIAGFIIAVEKGWLVRKDQNGATTRIRQIGPAKVKASDIVLD